MDRAGSLRFALAALLVGWGAPLSRLVAQSASELLGQGVRAYQTLEYEAAVTYLRASITRQPALPDSQRARALAYLAATELFQGKRDSATAAFRMLVRINPRYRPDELIFPPQVTNLFEEVRRSTKVLTVEVPPQTEVRPRQGSFTARLIASSVQPVTVTLARDDGTLVRKLYDGPVAESLVVKWDGLTAQGGLPEEGRYVLRIDPHMVTEDGPRPLQVTLDVAHLRPDTLPWPAAPASLLPERTSATPALGSLGAAALAGGATVGLPALFGRSGDATGARFVVAAVVGIAGIIGFVRHQPQPIEANIRANRPVRDEWQQHLKEVRDGNLRARAVTGLLIRAGPVSVADRGAP